MMAPSRYLPTDRWTGLLTVINYQSVFYNVLQIVMNISTNSAYYDVLKMVTNFSTNSSY